MVTRISRLAGFVGLLVLGSAAHASTPTPAATGINEETGHVYEVWASNGISWQQAQDAVDARNVSDPRPDGVKGHLATITSEAEDIFVDNLRTIALGSGLAKAQVWIGGERVGSGWRWVSEGAQLEAFGQPFPGTNTGPAYTNWANGEPNNSGGQENGVTLGRYHPVRGWNDEGAAPGSIGGYIVEYDVPRDAACDGSTCKTIQGQLIEFPQGSYEAGDKIGFSAYEFTDPRVAVGTCGLESLTLFDGDGVPNNELVIPPYLCGSPKFVAVRVNSEELTIDEGVVLVENFTNEVLEDNAYPDGQQSICEDPISQETDFSKGDPQYQDIVVWQSTNPGNMRETGFPTEPQFAGSAGEFTDGCGSSRGKTLGASYFVVGMRIDFGSQYTWAGNPDGNRERFVALTRYKLELLLQSVNEAGNQGWLPRRGEYLLLRFLVENAIWQLDRGRYAAALWSMNWFDTFQSLAHYRPGPPKNYEGEHISRSSNIGFMLRVKVIPYD